MYHRLLGMGWTYTRGSGLAAYCYMTPKLEGKKSRGTMGVDMFGSEDAVLAYLRGHVQRRSESLTPVRCGAAGLGTRAPALFRSSCFRSAADLRAHFSRPARRHPEILGADTERLLNLDDEEDPGAAC